MDDDTDIGQPIGVGLIGYGASGSILHAGLIAAEPRLRLRAVVSRRPERVHRDLPDLPVAATPAELLVDPAVELVVVAAPNAVHHKLAAAALRAGRHVVVEKPFVVRAADADDLIALAERHGRLLSVFQNRRWDNDFRTVERCVRVGVLGEVSTYIARWDRYRPQPKVGWLEEDRPGSGVLYDLGVHLIDQALHLFGRPATITADISAQRPGVVVPDYMHVVLGYGALRVILHAGSLLRAPGPRFEVHGDKGSFVKHGIDPQEAALRAGVRPGDPRWGQDPENLHGTLTTDVDGLEVTGRLRTLPGAYETFYREMARAIRGESPVPVDPRDARNTIWLIERALESSRESRTVELG
jgi:scyllo-inositol 2-dehydrogenase (NADP+)